MHQGKVLSVVEPTSELAPAAFPLKKAATYSGLTVWFLRTQIWDGILPARLAGKCLLVLRSDLDKLVQSLPQVRSGPCYRAQRKRKKASAV
jgi:hypothetical protein